LEERADFDEKNVYWTLFLLKRPEGDVFLTGKTYEELAALFLFRAK